MGSEGTALQVAFSLRLSPPLPGRRGAAADTGVQSPSAFVRGVRAREGTLAAVDVSGDATPFGLRVPDALGEAGKGMGTGGPDRGDSRARQVRRNLHYTEVGLGERRESQSQKCLLRNVEICYSCKRWSTNKFQGNELRAE